MKFNRYCRTILFFLQRTHGSYLALLGWVFTWLTIMITAIILLRKNKANLLSKDVNRCMVYLEDSKT